MKISHQMAAVDGRLISIWAILCAQIPHIDTLEIIETTILLWFI